MSSPPTAFDIRADWLALRKEPAFDPGQRIIDSHHHLYHRPGLRYLLDELASDLAGGHDLRATVAVQARAMLRADGPPELAALGETEFLNGQAAMAASGGYGPVRVAAGIVGHADLRLGNALPGVLERHISAAGGLARAGGRLCGIRQPLAWDADATLLNPAYATTEAMADDPALRTGLAVLARMGLTFDIWAFYPQLPRLAAMARAVPDLSIVLDHVGGVIRAGGHAGRDIFPEWRAGLARMAACPNVSVKLSGLGMRLSAFGFDERPEPPASEDLSRAWRPWVLTALDLFGPDRCMWGSNFPVDKGAYAYGVGLNAMQRLTADFDTDARDAIFWGTAARVYGLG
jgi:predicted TIM-barrel fold metal-dependent hydrolase